MFWQNTIENNLKKKRWWRKQKPHQNSVESHVNQSKSQTSYTATILYKVARLIQVSPRRENYFLLYLDFTE